MGNFYPSHSGSYCWASRSYVSYAYYLPSTPRWGWGQLLETAQSMLFGWIAGQTLRMSDAVWKGLPLRRRHRSCLSLGQSLTFLALSLAIHWSDLGRIDPSPYDCYHSQTLPSLVESHPTSQWLGLQCNYHFTVSALCLTTLAPEWAQGIS